MGGIADDRDHLAPAARGRALDHAVQQQPPDAAPPRPARDVDRILDREAVGRPRAVDPGIGVAGDAAVELGDQIGQPGRPDRLPALA